MGKQLEKGTNFISILPLAHMYGMAFELIYEFLQGKHVFFLTRVPSPSVIAQAFAEIKPAVIVAVPFRIWNREWKKLLVFPWLPLAVILLIAVPWAFAQHRAEPDFWRYFFVEEHLKRFTSGTYDRKPQPFWYFIPVLIGGVMPVGLLWIAGALGCTKEHFKRPFVRFMLCWFAFPVLFFSASKCKLGTYILPCFPPLALLLASALQNAWENEKLRARCRKLYAAVGAVLIIGGAMFGELRSGRKG